MTELRNRMRDALDIQFQQEMDMSLTKLKDGFEPYSRFVKNEKQKVTKVTQKLDSTAEAIVDLRAEIQTTFKK
jgi:hypothetical protein